MTSLVVRDARPEDAVVIAHLCGQLAYPADAASMPGRMERVAKGGDGRTLVAAIGDSVVGVETVHVRQVLNHEAPIAQITLLVVDEAHRGAGAGRALVTAAETWAAERGCHRIVVTTALHRAGAHTFYERLGYAHTGRRYGRDFTHPE